MAAKTRFSRFFSREMQRNHSVGFFLSEFRRLNNLFHCLSQNTYFRGEIQLSFTYNNVAMVDEVHCQTLINCEIFRGMHNFSGIMRRCPTKWAIFCYFGKVFENFLRTFVS